MKHSNKNHLNQIAPLQKYKNTVQTKPPSLHKQIQPKIRSQSNTASPKQPLTNKLKQKQQKNIPKINSILELSKHIANKEERPISQQRKKQHQSIERLIVNKNVASKSIVQSKNFNESKIGNRGKQISIKQKDTGLIWMNPQFDTLQFQDLQMIDSIYQKYYEMINNDSDILFVMNAVPQIKPYKTQPNDNKVDFFMSNKISRISGQFSQLTSQKIISILKNKPNYLDIKDYKVFNEKIILITKWKVVINIGFLQYITESNKIIISRIYLSKIYRKMNYLGYVYTQIFNHLFDRFEGIDRISIFLHDRNLSSVKFMKFLGGKIQRIFTDSSNHKVDYYQQFVCKKKDVLKSMEKLEH